MSQVGRLKYTADKWNVEIDGYSIPFPDLKLARGYLAYIRLWADYGEVISYDHANQTLFWSKYPPVSCRGCQLSRRHRRHRGIHRYKQSTQFQTKATPKDSSL